MSLRATAWAWTVQTTPTAKLVLLALADFADEVGDCWPGMARVVKMTGLSERAVRSNLRTLEASNIIRTDRGDGRGHTSRYALQINRAPERGHDVPERGHEVPPFMDAERGQQMPERGHLVPERGQHVPERGQQMPPNRKEPSRTVIEPPARVRAAPAAAVELPAWLPPDAWADFCRHREAMGKKAWTQRAAELSIRDLGKLRDQGNDPQAVIEQSIANGWRGLFPLKGQAPKRESKMDWLIRDMMENP